MYSLQKSSTTSKTRFFRADWRGRGITAALERSADLHCASAGSARTRLSRRSTRTPVLEEAEIQQEQLSTQPRAGFEQGTLVSAFVGYRLGDNRLCGDPVDEIELELGDTEMRHKEG
jgi:hypothetical protein